MKKSTIVAVALVLASGVMESRLIAQAQPQPAPKVATRTNAPAGAARFDRTEYLAKRLDLTEEQKQKVRPILAEETKLWDEMRQAKDMKPQDRSAKAREIREATNAKLKPILTPEQWEKHTKPLQTRVQPTLRTNAAPATPPASPPAK
jgi:Spy/CpxP family protein refolding chaperone